MDCEAEAIITRVYYEFQNGLEPSIDVSDLVDEKEPSKEEKINNVSVKLEDTGKPSQIESVVDNAKIKN